MRVEAHELAFYLLLTLYGVRVQLSADKYPRQNSLLLFIMMAFGVCAFHFIFFFVAVAVVFHFICCERVSCCSTTRTSAHTANGIAQSDAFTSFVSCVLFFLFFFFFAVVQTEYKHKYGSMATNPPMREYLSRGLR